VNDLDAMLKPPVKLNLYSVVRWMFLCRDRRRRTSVVAWKGGQLQTGNTRKFHADRKTGSSFSRTAACYIMLFPGVTCFLSAHFISFVTSSNNEKLWRANRKWL